MQVWKRRADWLERNYITNVKETKTALADLLHFANGDSTGETVIHWCLVCGPNGRPCCASNEDAFAKLLSHVIPFFTKGFQTPLLYRMKHFGPASSFVKLGCVFFNLLPRALQELHTGDPSADVAALADVFLSETGYRSVEADLQQILADAMDMDKDYATQNKVRRGQVVEEMNKASFLQGIMVVDALIEPIEYGVNTLLGHTRLIHDLQFLGKGHPACNELKTKASRTFLRVVRGEFADDLIGRYMGFFSGGLQHSISMGLDPQPDLLNKVFQLITVCITDVHRRFKYDFACAPFALFGLLGLSTERFVQRFDSLEARLCACQDCLDAGFSAKLVKSFSGLASKSLDEQTRAKEEVQSILQDISEWCPLTSDSVELKNGQTQWVASKRGGQNVKNPLVASETTFLQAAVKQHVWAQDSVGSQTLPSKRTSSGILKMVGVKSSKSEAASVQ